MKKRRMALAEYEKHLETHAITITVPLDGSPYEPERFEIDFDIIPECICERVGRDFYELYMDFIKQPGGREFLDARNAELKGKQKEQLAAEEPTCTKCGD